MCSHLTSQINKSLNPHNTQTIYQNTKEQTFRTLVVPFNLIESKKKKRKVAELKVKRNCGQV